MNANPPNNKDVDIKRNEMYEDHFFIHYNRKDLAKQLAGGIEYDQQVNDKKHDNLKIASFSLMIGIIASVAAGVHFLVMSL